MVAAHIPDMSGRTGKGVHERPCGNGLELHVKSMHGSPSQGTSSTHLIWTKSLVYSLDHMIFVAGDED